MKCNLTITKCNRFLRFLNFSSHEKGYLYLFVGIGILFVYHLSGSCICSNGVRSVLWVVLRGYLVT